MKRKMKVMATVMTAKEETWMTRLTMVGQAKKTKVTMSLMMKANVVALYVSQS